jgi:Fe2+ transport system protein FeoA
MKPDCQVVCCPNCGYGQVDLERSTLAKWFYSIFKPSKGSFEARECCSLVEVTPGQEVRVTGYGDLPLGKLEQLQAYGLVIGRPVKVLQQEPVTIVLADHTELALEAPLAEQVSVEVALDA